MEASRGHAARSPEASWPHMNPAIPDRYQGRLAWSINSEARGAEGAAGEPNGTAGELHLDTHPRPVWSPGRTCLGPTVLVPSQPPFWRVHSQPRVFNAAQQRQVSRKKFVTKGGQKIKRGNGFLTHSTVFHFILLLKPYTSRPEGGPDTLATFTPTSPLPGRNRAFSVPMGQGA